MPPAFARFFRGTVHWGALAVKTAVDLTVVASSILPVAFGVSWVTSAILLATAAFTIWTAVIVGIWWMAPTFQSLRDGSLPMLPRFPFRSLGGPALLAAEIVFKSYVIARFGILALLAMEVPIVLFRLLPLLNKHVPRPGDQA